MRRLAAITALQVFAYRLSKIADGSEWYLFGSVDRDNSSAADVDLLILCRDADQASGLRTAIDPDICGMPLHLSLMTYDEAKETGAVSCQRATKIYPVTG